MRPLFEKVEATLKFDKVKGKDGRGANHFNWLTGWALEAFLQEHKAKLDAKRAATYLENAQS